MVYPSNEGLWTTADTRTGGAVSFVADATPPAGTGALQLTTDNTTAAKAQYMHPTQMPLADVTELSYFTKQNSASFAGGAPSYQLPVFLDGVNNLGFTTFVYEPYQGGAGPVVPGIWQYWDVDQGQMWSSRSYTDGGTCTVTAGAGGAPFYTLSQIKANCPSAEVIGFGVNIGTFNPGYNVLTDLVSFNGHSYDFEESAPLISPETRDECRDRGWMTFNSPVFKNQGDCVSYVSSNENASGNKNK